MADFTPITEVRAFLESGTTATARINIGLGNVDDTTDLLKPISTATQAELDATNAKIDKTLYSGAADSGSPWILDLSSEELLEGLTHSELYGVAKIAVYGNFQSGLNAKGFYEVSAIWDDTGTGILNLETGVSDLMDSYESFTISTSTVSGKLRLTMESTTPKTIYASIIYNNLRS